MTYNSFKPSVCPTMLYSNLFESLPGSCILLQNDAPRYTILAVTPEYLVQTGTTKEYLIGKGIFEAFPSNPDDPTDTGTLDVRSSLDHVRLNKEAHQLPIQRYDIAGQDGHLTQTYWSAINKPVFSPEGEVAYIIHTAQDITSLIKSERREEEHQELQQAYEKIESSEANYRNLFESMDQGYCTLEIIFEGERCVDFKYLETNPAFESHLGMTNVLGKTIREIAPNIEQKWFDFYGGVALTGNPIRIEEESKAFNKWFEVYAIRIGRAEERKIGVFFTDITSRKKAEEAITQSESNLRNTILQAPVAMAILRSPSFVVEIANEQMFKLWGRSKEELLNKPLFERLPEVKNQGYEELLTNVFTTGERFSVQGTPVTLPRKEGIETVYVDVLYEAFREADGTISGVIVVATDVTHQVIARMKIEESNKDFQFVTDFMPQMIWVTRPDGYHYYYNKQWYDYTGLTYGETEGEGWNGVFHPDDQERAWKQWRHSLATGDPYEIEYRCRRYDGEYRWVLGRALPLKDETGTILKWFGTCTDIHDQKIEAELLEDKVKERTKELQIANQELARSNVNLGEFAYAASHDLKEPIRKIHFFADRLRSTLSNQLNEEQARSFERLETSARRMSSLIDNLLSFSQVSFHPNVTEEVNLNQLIDVVLEDLELEIEDKGAIIEVDKLFTIKGHHRQLQQAFQNLIGNAIKYSKPGMPPKISISCSKVLGKELGLQLSGAEEKRLFYFITVSDNGIGFEQADAERIFNVFTRLHGNSEYKGTGIGLSIVRKVIENHNGHIRAESAPGEGTTFKIYLPAE